MQGQKRQDFSKAFALGIVLNTAYVMVEAFYGFRINSSSLLADAGHNLSDVVSLVIAWAATGISKRRSTNRHTYGLKKSTILASMANGLLIVGASVFILIDAFGKIENPQPIPGEILMWVAGVGILVNTGTALLFMKGRKTDLNIKGAFLHMAADAAVTLGVLLGGLTMKLTGEFWIDPILSFVIVGVILYSAWGLLSDSLNLALDGVPENIDVDKVAAYLRSFEMVEEVHDLHIWALSTTETACTVHLVVPQGHSDDFLVMVRDSLRDEFGIGHSTIQVEKTFFDEEYRKPD